MVNFMLNLIFFFLVVVGLVVVWKNRRTIFNFRLRSWSEEATKLDPNHIPNLVRFVNGVQGLDRAQRAELMDAIQAKLSTFSKDSAAAAIPPTVAS